jgi:hypothetical protein
MSRFDFSLNGEAKKKKPARPEALVAYMVSFPPEARKWLKRMGFKRFDEANGFPRCGFNTPQEAQMWAFAWNRGFNP